MISACLGFFDPAYPLEISVKYHVLEIAGLDSESGLKVGDFFKQKSPSHISEPIFNENCVGMIQSECGA
jgi:hypothetical protein